MKSDHRAVIAYTGPQKRDLNKRGECRTFRKRTPTQRAIFLQYASQLNIELPADDDTQAGFDYMYDVMASLLDRFYPEREITVTTKDPRFVTPAIKAMLRRKNRLMRAGRTEEADTLSRRVRDAITRQNRAWLRRVNTRQNVYDAWEKVREVTGRNAKRTVDVVEGITAQVLNDHYAAISHDRKYQVSSKKLTALGQNLHITEEEVFHILDHLKPTATGLDGIPAWFLRLGAAIFAAPLADLFNRSTSAGVVPNQWKKAIITPVPKVKPAQPSDYRSISIIAVLSRAYERHIVRTHIYPALELN